MSLLFCASNRPRTVSPMSIGAVLSHSSSWRTYGGPHRAGPRSVRCPRQQWYRSLSRSYCSRSRSPSCLRRRRRRGAVGSSASRQPSRRRPPSTDVNTAPLSWPHPSALSPPTIVDTTPVDSCCPLQLFDLLYRLIQSSSVLLSLSIIRKYPSALGGDMHFGQQDVATRGKILGQESKCITRLEEMHSFLLFQATLPPPPSSLPPWKKSTRSLNSPCTNPPGPADDMWEYSYVDISLCDYSICQQGGISDFKFPKRFLEISWAEISLYSLCWLYWLYNDLSFLSNTVTNILWILHDAYLRSSASNSNRPKNFKDTTQWLRNTKLLSRRIYLMNMLLIPLMLIAIFLIDCTLGNEFDSQCINDDIYQKDSRGMQRAKKMLWIDQAKSETIDSSTFEWLSVPTPNDVAFCPNWR